MHLTGVMMMMEAVILFVYYIHIYTLLASL